MRRTIPFKLWLALVGLCAYGLFLLVLPLELVAQSPPVSPGDVVINEVAWGGTAASSADEWIELYNTTSEDISLDNWSLASLDGTPAISLSGSIPAGGFFLLERSDQDTISDVTADLIYTGALDNGGEALQLFDTGSVLIDSANLGGSPWMAGSGAPDYFSMERIDPLLGDSAANWASNDGITRNGLDADGFGLNATPGQANSVTTAVPTPTPSPTATPTPAPGDVVINEVAWGGTAANAADEWIELRNTTTETLDLTGWSLVSLDGTPAISLSGVVPASGFLLLERTDDNTISDIPADLFYTGGLDNDGETLQLVDGAGQIIDTANTSGGAWPAGSGAPDYYSMERVDALSPNWASNNGVTRNGLDADGNPVNGTPGQANSTTIPLPTPTPPAGPPPRLLISEFVYDGITPSSSGDEFVEVCNAEATAVDLTGFKLGDEESPGGGEGMYSLPDGRVLDAGDCLVVAKNAAQYAARFGSYPDYELVITGSSYTDTLAVPNLARYTAWGSGSWGLADDGDEVLMLDPGNRLVDSVAYGSGDYAAVGVTPDASAPEPNSLQRVWPLDTDSMPADFVRKAPNPRGLTSPPAPPSIPPTAPDLPLGMQAYWGILHSHSSYSDGAGPPVLAFATARANGLHFLALTDQGSHLTPGEWADLDAQATGASTPGEFIALPGYEYTHPTDGHVTVWNTADFTSSEDPLYDTLPEFYAWLGAQPEALAEFNHPFPASDFQDFAFDPTVVSQMAAFEVGNGSELYSQYHTFEAQWMRALHTGWHTAPVNNSDTRSAYWGADTRHRTGLVAPALREADLLEAVRARRVFATEDPNLALTMRSGDIWMGSTVSGATTLTVTVNVIDLDPATEAITLTVYDRALPLTSSVFTAPAVEWTVAISGQPGHFYWARAIQADGDLAQTAPLWTDGVAIPETVVLNEILPAPHGVDWDGDGTADYQDEWIELYNPGTTSVGLGGWQVGDASGASYVIPLDKFILPGQRLVFYRRETNLALNNDDETVVLWRSDGTMADNTQYGSGPSYDVSLCRMPDASGGWNQRCDPTPGAPNRALPVPGPLEVSVFEARHVTLGAWVKVRGHVTVPPGVFGQRTAYIQDETGGIKVYLPNDFRSGADLGDRWEVTGKTQSYYGELEIRVSDRQDVDFLEHGNPPPPLPIGTGVMVEPYEGTLVLVSGWAVDFERGGHFWTDDGSGWARIYLDRDTGIRRPWLEVGQSLQAVGVVSQYSPRDLPGGYRLLPRYPFDLVIQQAPVISDTRWPAMLPETGRR